MNTKIKNLDISKILFWDLESVRESEELEPDSEAYHLYEHKTRNRDTDEVLTQQEVLDHYKKKAALSPTHNKIVCISMAVVSKGSIVVKSITGTQLEIIQEFNKVLSKGYIPCGWNVVGFDFPVLLQKAFQEGLHLDLPEKFNCSGKKEWQFTEVKYDINIIDLMLLLKGTYFYNQSLAEACYLAKIPSPKNDGIEGSQVSEVYYSEGVERVSKYCERDVVSCVHLLQKMRGEELTQNIIYSNEKEKSTPLLNAIYNQKNISKEHEAQIIETAKGLTKKEKEGFITLIKASLARTEKEGYSAHEEALFEIILTTKKTKK